MALGRIFSTEGAACLDRMKASRGRCPGSCGGAGYHNATALTHPHLMWLGDLVPVPGPLPNVLSIGDCIIFAGMLVLLHRTCGRAAALRDLALEQQDLALEQ